VLLIGLSTWWKRGRGLDTDPFQFVEKEGYYYGRGTQDMERWRSLSWLHVAALQAGRLRARPRHHSALTAMKKADVKWRGLAAQESP